MSRTPGGDPEDLLSSALRAQASGSPPASGSPSTTTARGATPQRERTRLPVLRVLLFALVLGLLAGVLAGALTLV